MLLSEYWRLSDLSLVSLTRLYDYESLIFLNYSSRVALNVEEGLIVAGSGAINCWASQISPATWARLKIVWMVGVLARVPLQVVTIFLRVWEVYYLIRLLNLNWLALLIRRNGFLRVSYVTVFNSSIFHFLMWFKIAVTILIDAQTISKIILFKCLEVFIIFIFFLIFFLLLWLLVIVLNVLVLLRLRNIMLLAKLLVKCILMHIGILLCHAIEIFVLTS